MPSRHGAFLVHTAKLSRDNPHISSTAPTALLATRWHPFPQHRGQQRLAGEQNCRLTRSHTQRAHTHKSLATSTMLIPAATTNNICSERFPSSARLSLHTPRTVLLLVTLSTAAIHYGHRGFRMVLHLNSSGQCCYQRRSLHS